MNQDSRIFVNGVLCAVCVAFLLILGGIRVVADINFNRNCKGYLKRAADANTVALAKEQLNIAVSYIEWKQLKGGYTSILYKTPDEDIEFWYTNINNALTELRTLAPETTPLERSNMLIKLRETLLDHSSRGTIVTIPSGISVFPHNKPLAYASIIILILGVVFGWRFFRDL